MAHVPYLWLVVSMLLFLMPSNLHLLSHRPELLLVGRYMLRVVQLPPSLSSPCVFGPRLCFETKQQKRQNVAINIKYL